MTEKYSKSAEILQGLEDIKHENESLARELEIQRLLEPVEPFSAPERTEDATKKRIKRALEDFWYFDSVYFPEEMYQAYARPGWFHHELFDIAQQRDGKAHVIAGPRDSAKTGTYKKILVWYFLNGAMRYVGVGSSTLGPATDTVRDIRNYLMSNPRILHDFDLLWGETSEERLYAKSIYNSRGTFMDAISEERSTRGRQRNFFLRYEFIYVTDLENRESSLTPDSIEKRLDRLDEMRTSLAESGVLIWEGNNFDARTAMNQLKQEDEKGILSENYVFHCYPAWEENREEPCIWNERYPAQTEQDLKRLMQPKDNHDWDGNFQQNPTVKSGDIFPDTHYREWIDFPPDIKAVLYTDPNLAKKSKGDQTAIICYGFSPKEQRYYIPALLLRSFSDSNDLLDEFIRILVEQSKRCQIITQGFDGNVTQESTWTNNVRHYSQTKGAPFPHLEYKHYNVDDITKNCQAEWANDRILFPPGFAHTQTGAAALQQIFGFRGKKANNPDDAPDALICAHELLQECGYGIMLSGRAEISVVSNRKFSHGF